MRANPQYKPEQNGDPKALAIPSITALGRALFEIAQKTNPGGSWWLNPRVVAASYWNETEIKAIAHNLLEVRSQRSVAQVYLEDSIHESSTW